MVSNPGAVRITRSDVQGVDDIADIDEGEDIIDISIAIDNHVDSVANAPPIGTTVVKLEVDGTDYTPFHYKAEGNNKPQILLVPQSSSQLTFHKNILSYQRQRFEVLVKMQWKQQLER